MSDDQQDGDTQAAAELAAVLVDMLADGFPPDMLRAVEPEVAFSTELTSRPSESEPGA